MALIGQVVKFTGMIYLSYCSFLQLFLVFVSDNPPR